LSADYQLCLRASRQAEARALAAGDGYLALMYKNLGLIALLQLGQWRRMRQETESALAMAETNANRLAATMYRLMIAWLHVEVRDFQGAVAACQQASHPVMDEIPLFYFLRRIILTKAYVGLGDHATAGTRVREFVARLAENATGTTYPTIALFTISHCEYLLAIGDLPAARREAGQLHVIAAPAPDRNNLALAHWYHARAAIAANDLPEAEARLSKSLAILEQAELPHAAWRIYATAAAFYETTGNIKKATGLRGQYNALIATLADNFDQDDPIRAGLRRI
jgi:hypothetical protein